MSCDAAPTGWKTAYETASAAASPLPEVQVDLHTSTGRVISRDLTALTDLPPFDSSAMDGWVVFGDGPWKAEGRLLAGDTRPSSLQPGHAIEIATGAAVPDGACGVLRYERGRLDGNILDGEIEVGADIRTRGHECRAGDILARAGQRVTPALVGLAAAAGHDWLRVRKQPVVDVLVLGEELLSHGRPTGTHVRDALAPMLRPWLQWLGAAVGSIKRVGDDLEEITKLLATSTADLLITTGGTAKGPVDHLRSAVCAMKHTMLVDTVSVRPGHPMLLARLPTANAADRLLVGLPGNPLAAISGFLTLAVPVLRSLHGETARPLRRVQLDAEVAGHPSNTKLIPIRGSVPLAKTGPAMLSGLAYADAIAVIPENGVRAAELVEVLDLPLC